jgi:hypothetical protein
MAKKVDNIIKDYLSKNDRFKDILNYYLFKGRQVVKESDLKELDTTLVNTEGDIFENFRDLFKEVCIVKENRKNTFLLIGIENQTRMDYEMVSRVFLYDALSLRKVFKNNDKVKPIITIVIYYGEKKWNCPKSLYDYYRDMDEDMDDELCEFMPNYFINVIEPYQMTDDDINKFKSDFKIVCDFIRKSKDIKGIESIRKNNDKIEDETIDLINYITNSNLVYDKERGIDSMCKGLDEFEKRAKNEGRTEGLAEGETKKLNENIKTMHSNGATDEMIAKLLSLDINYVKEVLSK